MDFQLTPEQRDLQQLVRGIAQKHIQPLATRWDHTHAFPWDWPFANETAIRVSNQAMQLFGGHGYLKSIPSSATCAAGVSAHWRAARRRFSATSSPTPWSAGPLDPCERLYQGVRVA